MTGRNNAPSTITPDDHLQNLQNAKGDFISQTPAVYWQASGGNTVIHDVCSHCSCIHWSTLFRGVDKASSGIQRFQTTDLETTRWQCLTQTADWRGK